MDKVEKLENLANIAAERAIGAGIVLGLTEIEASDLLGEAELSSFDLARASGSDRPTDRQIDRAVDRALDLSAVDRPYWEALAALVRRYVALVVSIRTSGE